MKYAQNYYTEAVIIATLEATIEHLKEKEPKRTLTARQLIRKGIMEALNG